MDPRHRPGVLGGLWGSLAGVLAPRGGPASFVLGYGVCLLAGSVLLLVLGLVAWCAASLTACGTGSGWRG